MTGAIVGLHACGGGGGGAPASPAPGPVTSISPPRQFVDVTAGSGIAYQIGYRIPQTINDQARFSTSGVASGDYDDDGDIDLFIVRGDIGPNLLYRNDGNGVFVDVAAAAGVAYTATATENYRHTGPAFADMDGDGDLDLFIGGLWNDPPFIYANNGDGTFTDVTAGSGIDQMQAEHSVSASFGDYDLDGDLDMFITHFGTDRDPVNPGDTEHLWRNDSDGGTIRFTSVSESAGISPSILTLPDPRVLLRGRDFTFTANFVRIDDDLYPDIVITADNDQSMVFMNNGDGSFRNATDVTVITDSFGMGSALGDYDDDGDLDWFVTSIYGESDLAVQNKFDGNRLYRNDDGVFVDVTRETGTIDGAWGWGACFLDIDNDGDLDIYHTNGWTSDAWRPDVSRVFESDGTGVFQERARLFGLDDTDEGRGIVCADFDNDGDVDILQLHRSDPVAATLWRNDERSNNSLRVRLRGRLPNSQAAGARIHVTAAGRTMMREISIGNNFVSQNPTLQVFGLGKLTQADEVRVEWPDDTETVLAAVLAGPTLTVTQTP